MALDFLPNRPTTTTVQTVAISHNIAAILLHLWQITSQNLTKTIETITEILMISTTNTITNITNYQLLTIKIIK